MIVPRRSMHSRRPGSLARSLGFHWLGHWGFIGSAVGAHWLGHWGFIGSVIRVSLDRQSGLIGSVIGVSLPPSFGFHWIGSRGSLARSLGFHGLRHSGFHWISNWSSSTRLLGSYRAGSDPNAASGRVRSDRRQRTCKKKSQPTPSRSQRRPNPDEWMIACTSPWPCGLVATR